MNNVRIRKKGDRTIVSKKLRKDEQFNYIELDVLKQGEIPELAVPDIINGMTGRSIIFELENYVPLADYLKSGIRFSEFLYIADSISKTIRSCESRGIRKGNLELYTEDIFYNHMAKQILMLYWPLISLEAYADDRDLFMRLGENVRLSPAEPEGHAEYMAFFEDRKKFDLFRFEDMLGSLSERSEQEAVGKRYTPVNHFSIREEAEDDTCDDYDHTVMITHASLYRDSDNTAIDISALPFWLGRSSECNHVIAASVVSKKHALIISKKGKYYIQDNNSTNGTRLNGEIIPPTVPVPLHSGDLILIGQEALLFNES